ncbi:unnamed protein product [Closterium sp. NIES-54]
MNRMKLRQIDVANAFLYVPVDAEIFVKHPHGSNADPNQVCQLQKSLYSIKQAPRLWQQHFHAHLIRIGFCQLPHDHGMYRLTQGTNYILLIVYVDDLLYIGSTDDRTTWFEGELQRDLTLTVATTVTLYLGLNIQDGENAIYLSAEKYTDTIAKRFGLTPTAITTPYCYTDGNREVSALLKPAGIRDYQRKLGCLLFAAVTCQLDLSYLASQLTTYLKKPEAEHMMELDRALHYLVSTPTIGLTYHKTKNTTPKLISYVDADHAGDSDNRRSRTGYIYRLEPIGPISWQLHKQELIALSSAAHSPAAPTSYRPCCPVPSRPFAPAVPSRRPYRRIAPAVPSRPVAPAVPLPLLSRPVAPAAASPLLSCPVPSPLLSRPIPSPLLSRCPCCPVTPAVPSRRPCHRVAPAVPSRPVASPPAVPSCPVVPAVPSRPVVPTVPSGRPPSVPPHCAVHPVPSRPRLASCPVQSHAPRAPCPSVAPPLRPAHPSRPVHPDRPSCPMRLARPSRPRCALPVRCAPCALLAHETLWAHASGDLPEPADPAPLAADPTPANSYRYAHERADVTAWKSRDAAACIALSSLLPESEETHFTQVRTASDFLPAIKARYATPTTISLGGLFLPFLFPDLASFERTANLITHLSSLDSSYRAACTDAQVALLPPPMAITIYFIATSLPDRLASVRDALLLKHPSELTIEVLESALKDVESNLRSIASASGVVAPPLFHGCTVPQLPTFTASLATAATDVTAAAVTTSSWSRGRSGRRGGQGAGGGGGGGGGDVASGGGGSAGAGGAPRAAASDSPAAAGGGDARVRQPPTGLPAAGGGAVA